MGQPKNRSNPRRFELRAWAKLSRVGCILRPETSQCLQNDSNAKLGILSDAVPGKAVKADLDDGALRRSHQLQVHGLIDDPEVA
jgi:hypothetical protein